VAAVKTLLLYYEHHFDEYRKLNIKNPLFNANGGFLCFFWEFGAGRGMVVRQSLRLDGRKVCNIKMVGISQAESNKATVCALPSIHLPLTREASVIVLFEG
jgi:type II secretory pathway predicted ATPase ExeA